MHTAEGRAADRIADAIGETNMPFDGIIPPVATPTKAGEDLRLRLRPSGHPSSRQVNLLPFHSLRIITRPKEPPYEQQL